MKKAWVLGILIAILTNPIVYSPLYPDPYKKAGPNPRVLINEVLVDVMTSGNPISYPLTQIKIVEEEVKLTPLGIKNLNDETLQFTIDITIIEINQGDDPEVTFDYNNIEYTLEPGKADAYPITIKAVSGTGYLRAKMSIIDSNQEVYAQKEFIINID